MSLKIRIDKATAIDGQKINQKITHRKLSAKIIDIIIKSISDGTNTSAFSLFPCAVDHLYVILITVAQYKLVIVLRSSGTFWSLLSTCSQRCQVRPRLLFLESKHLYDVYFGDVALSPDVVHFCIKIESPGMLWTFVQDVPSQ